MPDRLHPNTALGAGHNLTSNNGVFTLAMQGDGNLVIYEKIVNKSRALWASNTAGKPGAWASMQGDGNFVVYSAGNQPLWASNTHGKPGAWVVMQDDGNLVVYAANGPAIWASNTMRVAKKTAFTSTKHGFGFNNQFVHVLATIPGYGPVETQGRCGGMAYAALDYYFANVPVPSYRSANFAPQTVPPDGHWLADYIFARLMNSFFTPSAIKFPEWTVHSDHETWFYKGVTRWTKEDEFPKLRASIDSGKPVALGLVGATNLGDIGNKNHQVVAYGYENYQNAGAMTVWIYDNNYPGKEIALTSEKGNPHWNASYGGVTWRGFFVHDYKHQNPPVYTRKPPASTATVKYGAVVKLSHLWTGRTLHSHALNYGHPASSGQQQVTAFEGADGNDFWRVKGPHGQPENHKSGQTVQHGDIIRLEHVATRRNLHSHSGHPSPVTKQQEATCFGSQGVGDSNDNWKVEVDPSGSWTASKRVRLVHANTNHTLHSHLGWSHSSWTAGQQEVTAYVGRDANDWWWLLEV